MLNILIAVIMTAEKNKTIKAMSKLLYTILTIGMLCTLQGRADHHIKKSTVKDFEEFSKILEGRWLVDIVFITDWPGLDRKKGDKIIGYTEFERILDGTALEWTHYAAEGKFRAVFTWDAINSTIRSFLFGANGMLWQKTWWKEKEGVYGWETQGSYQRDGRQLTGSGKMIFEKDLKSMKWSSKNMKMGTQKLDELRDVFKKVTP